MLSVPYTTMSLATFTVTTAIVYPVASPGMVGEITVEHDAGTPGFTLRNTGNNAWDKIRYTVGISRLTTAILPTP